MLGVPATHLWGEQIKLSGRGKSQVARCVGTLAYWWNVRCIWERVGEWGVLPMPVLSPCCRLGMALGIGASFDIEFVSVTKDSIIDGTGSGRS